MPERRDIIENRSFWDRLEYAACAWLQDRDRSIPGMGGIDGFLPDGFTNTRAGADVEGVVWILTGLGGMKAGRFVCTVPQDFLLKPDQEFRIEDLHQDEAGCLWLRVCRQASPRN